ncbi:MAG: hypothetical protein NZ108_08305, partial [Bacteroidia bacterium]|nr:hypothetical protein [Bacteroidia bacterium]
MNRWENLLRIAILGTQRQKLTEWSLPLGTESFQLSVEYTDEKKLLIHAAIESSYQKAGFLPAKYEGNLPEPFPT